jgi:hypothetical protein
VACVKKTLPIMKHLLLSAVLLCSTVISFGQAQEGSVTNPQLQQVAAVIELPYSTTIVIAALNDYMTRNGKTGGDDIKGYACYRDKKLTNELLKGDLYFKVEKKKKNESSTVSLLLSSPVKLATSASLSMEQAKAILDAFAPAVEAFNIELMIKDQTEAVSKAESKYKKIASEGEDLEKKRASIESKVQDNKKEQQDQQAEVDSEKQKLSDLMSKRKG